MKKIYALLCSVLFCLLLAGCGKEPVFQYVELGNNECAIVRISDKEIKSVKIPEMVDGLTVTHIEMGTFSNCTKLKKVKLPSTLKAIGVAAFMNCESLKKVEFPEGFEKIGELAFANCTSLKKITFSESLTSIGKEAFENCCSIKKLVLPDKVKTIEKEVFKDCTSLKQVELPKELERLEQYAFFNCSKLVGIEIPDKVNSLTGDVFQECYALKNIKVNENNATYTSKDIFGNEKNVIIEKGTSTLMMVNKELTVPDGVIEIHFDAFKHVLMEKDTESRVMVLPESLSEESALLAAGKLFQGTIRGKAGSTAELAAKAKNINFEVIE